MNSSLDLIQRLTQESPGSDSFSDSLNQFSRAFGWRPSFRIKDSSFSEIVNAHIMIEHGLENTAVISFIKGIDFSSLDPLERKRFIGISYNNLVDWHVIIQEDALYYIYNRSDPIKLNKIILDNRTAEMLRYEAFQTLVGRRPNPNVPALDDALIRRIEYWKTNLPNYDSHITVENISDIFNAIIFTRSLEDIKKEPGSNLINLSREGLKFSQAILQRMIALNGNVPDDFFALESLVKLDNLNQNEIESLLKDFYGNSYFTYDFSLMTKHALGKIYEKYVSVLEITQDSQPTLFPRPLREVKNRSLGTFYTPQYIASYFSNEVTSFFGDNELKDLKILDPTCGSGVFLRNILEHIIDRGNLVFDPIITEKIFVNTHGVDINYNAARASKLSLALLHLVANGKLPRSLSIYNEEVISYYMSNTSEYETFDVIVSNPPYVAVEEMGDMLKEIIGRFLDNNRGGRPELYIAILYLSYRLLKPGGIGLFILPQAFLVNENAKFMRKILSDNTLIRAIVDMSSIEVFDGVGAHVILLIFEKKSSKPRTDNPTVATISGLPGHALEQISERFNTNSKLYQISAADQDNFSDGPWVLLSGKEYSLKKKLEELPRLSALVKPFQGIVTGNDKIYIRDVKDIDPNELDIYIKLLPDKRMRPYIIDYVPEKYIFYPIINGEIISEDELASKYSKTYAYLVSKRSDIARNKKDKWWLPHRLRDPKLIRGPKIVAPHLLITPKFALDLTGDWATTRASSFALKSNSSKLDETDTLKILTAIMNSSVFNWYNSIISQKYGGGYTMIENKTVSQVPIPDLSKIRTKDARDIIRLVDKLLNQGLNNQIIEEIDIKISRLYGLSEEEALVFGISYEN